MKELPNRVNGRVTCHMLSDRPAKSPTASPVQTSADPIPFTSFMPRSVL